MVSTIQNGFVSFMLQQEMTDLKTYDLTLFISVFEQYQKARTAFVQAVADLSTRPQNIETLQNAGLQSFFTSFQSLYFYTAYSFN